MLCHSQLIEFGELEEWAVDALLKKTAPQPLKWTLNNLKTQND
ncbi:MAG: hypothetical protein MRERV_9c068 [Mycoplasmataceae bacterium RV_VA103A]|nr:MAG: hypothetical protein MRERV_9c068 [Mycoplasmataceae bacterium RV_VA103A]